MKWMGIKRPLWLEESSLFLGGPPDQCLSPHGLSHPLQAQCKHPGWVWWGENCMRMLACQLPLGPSPTLLILLCQNATKGALEVSPQFRSWEPDSKSWDLFLFLSRIGSWGYLLLWVTLFLEIQWGDTAFESCFVYVVCSASALRLPRHPSFVASRVEIFMSSGPFGPVLSHIYFETETTNFQVEIAL